MSYIKNIVAFDEKGNEYSLAVNGVSYNGKVVTDYSIVETGEVLKKIDENQCLLLIKSSGTEVMFDTSELISNRA